MLFIQSDFSVYNIPNSFNLSQAASSLSTESASNVCKCKPSVNTDSKEASFRLIVLVNCSTSYLLFIIRDPVNSPYIGCSTITFSTVTPQSTMAFSSSSVCSGVCLQMTILLCVSEDCFFFI